jgi:peptidoglycan/LPS O-acetylase OafA/YrhL
MARGWSVLDNSVSAWGRLPRVVDRCQGRDNNFNLIRILAAAGVLVSHAFPISLGSGAVEPLQAATGQTLGKICVLVFFALSGFFIAQSFTRTESVEAFLRARALRLFPALVVVLALTLLAGALLTTVPDAAYWAVAPDYFLRNLTLVSLRYDLPGVFADNPYGPAINGSLWTLIYEVLCYAGVLLAGTIGLLARPRLVLASALVVLVAGVVLRPFQLHVRIDHLLTLGLPFATGTALWVFRAVVPLSAALAVALLATAAAGAGGPLFLPLASVALAYAVLVAGYFPSRLLRRYNRLGDYSYGMYIYAFPIQQFAASLGLLTPWANIALAFPVTLACAVLSWHLIEEPALLLKCPRRRNAAAE